MANVYVDLDLASGLNDGTTWANAYQTVAAAFDGSLAGGDDVWIKGTQSIAANVNLNFGGAFNNPVKVVGCKSATTNEPPIQSDLIPGWRTGEARTAANLADQDVDCPSLTTTGTNNNISFGGFARIYAFNMISGFRMQCIASVTVGIEVEECTLAAPVTASMAISNNSAESFWSWKNCHWNGSAAIGFNTTLEWIGVITSFASAGTLFGQLSAAYLKFIGCDWSDQAHSILNVASAHGVMVVENTQLNASTALVTGTVSQPYRAEFYQCPLGLTGKASGTILNIDIATPEGTITEETTAVRTGGANDGTSNWAMAFTPVANGTRDGVLGLIGPWMAMEVAGDGTSKTLTVFIANSGAADYNDDDVWLEVMYPSEGGTAKWDFATTQMNLLGTPSAVTDDTTSTWGTGGNNPQKLQKAIAPDYTGILYCRVVFAKNFAASPETLYVDPLPTVA